MAARYLIRDRSALVLSPMGRGWAVVGPLTMSALEAEQAATGNLVRALQRANEVIARAALAPELRGVGASVAALTVNEGLARVAWVGDARVVRLRADALAALTRDHSLLEDYIRQKRLTPEEIASFPHPDVLVRALGMKTAVDVETTEVTTAIGDVFALMDRLAWRTLGEPTWTSTLRTHGHCPRECVAALLEQIAAAGGPEESTVVVVCIEPGGPIFAGGSGRPPGTEPAALTRHSSRSVA